MESVENQPWVELRLPVSGRTGSSDNEEGNVQSERLDAVASALALWGLSFELRDGETLLRAPADAMLGHASGQEIVVFVRPDELQKWRPRLLALLSLDENGIVERLRNEDEWRDVWKQFFAPLRVGRRFWVQPSWAVRPVAPGELVIELDPGRAFGTGRHASTQLVLECLETIAAGCTADTPGRFLDVGTGSGILAIGAARLWPGSRGLAVDTDPEAVACAAENLARLDLASSITARQTDEALLSVTEDPFDLVLANVTAPVLTALATAILSLCRPGCLIVLSGLLTSELDGVVVAYENAGATGLFCASRDEWGALVLANERFR